MRISVVTINYNNSQGLEKTIESVCRQKYNNIEHLIIDGGSTDSSVEVIRRYNHENMIWVSEKDSGIYNAQNKGIQKSTGDYILFLNSGDYFVDEHAISRLAVHTNGVDIIYGDILYISGNEEHVGVTEVNLDFLFFCKNTLPHPCTLIKKTLFELNGLYKEHIKICADWAFFIDVIIKHNASYIHVNSVISAFLIGGISTLPESNDKIMAEKTSYLKSDYHHYWGLYQKYLKIENENKKINTFLIKLNRYKIFKPLVTFLK